MPGAMSKANARQHTHNKEKYKQQEVRTARNKAKNIEAQKRFEEKKRNEKENNNV